MSFADEIDGRQTIEGILGHNSASEFAHQYYLEYMDDQGIERKALLGDEFLPTFWIHPSGPSKKIDGISGLKDFSSQKKVTVAFDASQVILNEDDAEYALDLRNSDIEVMPAPSFISSITAGAGNILNKLRGGEEEEPSQPLREPENDGGMIRAFGQVSEDDPTVGKTPEIPTVDIATTLPAPGSKVI